MKKLLYLFTLPNDIVTWLGLLAIWALWGDNLRMEGMALTCNLKPGSWPMNTYHWFPKGGWYRPWGATTLGHAIFYNPRSRDIYSNGEWSNTQAHEHVHVHQYQGAMLKSFVCGLIATAITGSFIAGGVLWSLGYLLMILSNFAVAKLRGVAPYRDCVHEEHAYAIGDMSWNEQKRKRYLLKYKNK